MTVSSDAWTAGAAYERYMGRWSRLLGRAFIEWLRPERNAHWLEIGCGTGALTGTVAALAAPASIVGCDPSAPFVEHARDALADGRISVVIAASDELPTRAGGFDFIVSGLVLNFIPEREAALVSMRERARPGGTVAAYVWDYQGGLEFLRYFWEAAVALDPGAASLDEARRFEGWNADTLQALFRDSGLSEIESVRLEVTTSFANFEDYWEPFLGGTGPAPSYVAALDRVHRDRLEESLRSRLRSKGDEGLVLRAAAHAVRGIAAR
jgi:SAM-dependent methyltransferase